MKALPKRPPQRSTSEGEQAEPREAFAEMLRAVKRNIVRVVFTTLVFLMLGIGLNMVWPSKFESSTTFALNEAQIVTDSAVLGELENIKLDKKLQALQAELRSSKRVSSVMDELQWKSWLETLGQPAARRRFVQKIQDNLEVLMSPGVYGVITVEMTFQWTSPREAADFVNRMRDLWIQLVLDAYRKGVDVQREEAEQRKLQREAVYQAALQARQKYEEENDVPSLLDMERNAELLTELTLRQTERRAELESIETQVQAVRVELQVLPKSIMAPAPAENPEQAKAMAKFAGAQLAFEEAETKYKPGHWQYDLLSGELDRAKTSLAAAGGEPTQQLVEQPNLEYVTRATKLEGLQAKQLELQSVISDMGAQILKVQGNMLRLPRVAMDLARYQTDVDLAQRLLTEATLELRPLEDRAQDQRHTAAVVANPKDLITSGPFEIIEVGIEPDRPVLPVGAVIMALSLLLGLGLGVSGPVLAEVTRSSFGSVKEVSRTLGLPVLGAVDLILTARDVRARTVQSVLSITTMVLVLLALGTALFMYANHQERLPQELMRAIKNLRLTLT